MGTGPQQGQQPASSMLQCASAVMPLHAQAAKAPLVQAATTQHAQAATVRHAQAATTQHAQAAKTQLARAATALHARAATTQLAQAATTQHAQVALPQHTQHTQAATQQQRPGDGSSEAMQQSAVAGSGSLQRRPSEDPEEAMPETVALPPRVDGLLGALMPPPRAEEELSSSSLSPLKRGSPRVESVQGASPTPPPGALSSSSASTASSSRSASPSPVPTLQQPPPPPPPPVVQPMVRRSGRHALAEDGSGATDEDVMQRAMRCKAEMNLDTAGMKQPSKSFISFPDSRISSNLSSLGASLGNTSDEISVSANVLRQMELDRLTVVSNVSTGPETSIIADDEEDDILDGQLLSGIIGNILEVDLEHSELSSVYDLKASARGSRSSPGKKSRRYCKRSKSKIVSQ
nr:uncharacterized protein LOC127348110 [Lolium perenne]